MVCKIIDCFYLQLVTVGDNLNNAETPYVHLIFKNNRLGIPDSGIIPKYSEQLAEILNDNFL
ncbi:MAG: hypothetical protein F6K17_14575 [Okeania sp. SIO3C4]|nr:hypothetical protein [Okeania sp. SIO3C4]